MTLTYAEFCAEYWRAEGLETAHRYDRVVNGNPGGYRRTRRLMHEASTWLRFATHPHATEVEG